MEKEGENLNLKKSRGINNTPVKKPIVKKPVVTTPDTLVKKTVIQPTKNLKNPVKTVIKNPVKKTTLPPVKKPLIKKPIKTNNSESNKKDLSNKIKVLSFEKRSHIRKKPHLPRIPVAPPPRKFIPKEKIIPIEEYEEYVDESKHIEEDDDDDYFNIYQELKDHKSVSVRRRKMMRIRKNLFYTFLVLSILSLIFTPTLATMFEFLVSPDSEDIKADWYSSPLDEKAGMAFDYSLKHWYFYFIPVMLLISLAFFVEDFILRNVH